MKRKVILLLLISSVFIKNTTGQVPVQFDDNYWDIIGGRVDTIDGRSAFTGTALLKDMQFTSGTIEWDIFADGSRSYAGILFRMQENSDFEEFYVRPHKANGLNADAFQYCPAYHGISCWQLFHGSRGTRDAVIPMNQWVHFKMVIDGNRAMVTMSGEEETAMLINHLDQEVRPGRVGIKGPADGTVWFSEVTVTDKIETPLPEPLPEKPEEPGIVKKWEISQSFGNDRFDSESYYSEAQNIEWRSVEPEKGGMVNLTRLVTRDRTQPGWLYARTFIESESDRMAHFQLGYSDYITVFINGKPLFSGTNGYRSRDPGFAGLIGYFDEVYLPLKKGNNEITLVIGEQFGGWGFMMRDAGAIFKGKELTKLWELKHQMNYPESVIYDPSTDQLFVTNFLSNSGGFVSRLSTDGEIIELKFASGLRNPTGISILNDLIYVVDRRNVAVIDKSTGEIINRIPLEGSIFPNDIVADDNEGVLYVSDNEADRIYIIRNNKAEIWMDGGDLRKPNGIQIMGDYILAGCTGYPALLKIDKKDRSVEKLATLSEGSVMDGIQVASNGIILFSDYNGHLYSIGEDNKVTLLLDTSTTGQFLADFEYIPGKNLLFIPGLYSNIITCFKFTEPAE